MFENVVKQLFTITNLQNATLVMDRIVGGSFEAQMYIALRQYIKQTGKNPIRKFKDEDSRKNNLLQVADMICGAVFRSYTREDDTFRKIIQAKEEVIIEW